MDSISDYLNRMTNSAEVRDKYQKMINDVLQDEDVFQFITENQERLSTEAVERSAASLYEYVVEKEKARKGKGQLMPGYVPQLIINNKHIEVTYVATADHMHERAQEDLKRRIRSVYMPKDIKDATFVDYEDTHGRREALDQAIRFVEEYVQNPDGFHKGLYLHGAFGVGKTYLLGAMAHELSTFGYPSTLVHYPTFTSEMRSSIGDDTTAEKLDAYKEAPILMLDDIGAEYPTDWIRDDVLGVILQYRMQNELPTLFSSNFDIEQLEEHLTYNQRGEPSPLKAQRIMERVKFLTRSVEVSGKNRRNVD